MKTRLYYMTKLDYAKRILNDGRFKLARIDQANDPFELNGAVMGDKIARRSFRAVYDHWAKSVGMLCTSRSWESPVMWAHYADTHMGVCIGFDVLDAEAHQVKYVAKRLPGLLSSVHANDPRASAAIKQILITKYRDWSYEREWRIFAPLSADNHESGLYFVNLDPCFQIREVILGCRCPITPKSFAAAIQAPTSEIEIFRARPAFNSFKIVRQQAEPAEFIYPNTRAA
ncbi:MULTISPECIES: DUF2971 domain-containing protein [Burkholderia cepacia complex]|uniref:DUF2971 domain-containing protein n=1 Tax=Burkholderia cepacia complex TaxID=87882 RepID=UPI000F089BFF|nr:MULTISPECIES: DUF2971 domain-containing protein [Burkholderia cepacia complex]AYQ44256.1 hypothetical protein CVS37_40820 [Burkholderia lata]